MTRSIAVLILGLSLVACGGGSSSRNSTSNGGIDESNVDAVAETVLKTVISTENIANSSGDFVRSVSLRANELVLLDDVLSKSALPSAAPAMQKAGAIPEQTQDCSVSGTISYSVEVASIRGISAGDTAEINFNVCDDGRNIVLDGGFNLEFESVSGDFARSVPPYEVTLAGSLLDFDVLASQSGSTVVANGDIVLSAANADSVNTQTSLSGTAISLSIGDISTNLRDYSFDEVSNGQTAIYTIDMQGSVDLSELDSSVSFATVNGAPLSGSESNLPSSGQLKVEGGNGSLLTITIVGADIQLDLDVEGDGQLDASSSLDWDSLEIALSN